MEEVESYDLVLLVKELRLAVKFPCKLTLQHGGRPVSPEIQSSESNVFPVNRDISIKEDSKRDYLEMNVNLATDKGGNIMAGIIKIHLKDIGSSEGESLTISLQKCLDPYATCLLVVKSVKINRSRVKKGAMGDDWKHKEVKFQSRSQAPVMDIRQFQKSRVRYNEAESYHPNKRVNINTLNSGMSHVKDKAHSTVGFRGASNSFDREELASRFKHFGRKEDDENKTTIPSKWRNVDESFKISIEANEKTLKLEILKYKTKFEEGERNIDEKTKQIKTLKDQVADMNRQLTEKHFLIEELSSKNTHITKLEESSKNISKQIHEERNKIIDLERELEEEKNGNFTQMSRYKDDNDKKEHELQKGLYEKREEIKQIMQENHYKINQINKMKGIIEDLETSLESKTYEFEKVHSHEKTEHNKTKMVLQQKINDLTQQVKKMEEKDHDTIQVLLKSEEDNKRLQNKLSYLEGSALELENKVKEEIEAKEKEIEEKKKLQKSEEELNNKLKTILREYNHKIRQFQELSSQMSELSTSSKNKQSDLVDKNKSYASKIQQLENKVNVLTVQEEKAKRNLALSQKEVSKLQDNQKIVSGNSKLKDDRLLQIEREMTEHDSKNNMKESLSKKQAEYKSIQLEKLTNRVTELERIYEREKETAEDRRLQILKGENKVRMLEEATSRLTEQIKDLKASQAKREDEWLDKLRELKDDLKTSQAKQSEYSQQIHTGEIEKINLRNQINRLEKLVENYSDKHERNKKRELQMDATIKHLSHSLEERSEEIVELQASFKILENEFRSLESDKTKTDKISNIIKEEKGMAVSDINKLKKQLEKREQKEEQYLEEVKNLKEEIVKMQLKLNATSKGFQKFKAGVTESIRNSLTAKSPYSSIESHSPVSLDHSRGYLNRSRMKAPIEYSIGADANETRLSEIIETYAKESQQAVMMLSEDLRKIKKEKETLEKDLQVSSIKFNEYEEDKEKRIIQLTAEIDTVTSQSAVEMEEYEEKIMYTEKELKKRDKNVNDLLDEIEEVKIIHQNEVTSNEVGISELLSKIHSLKCKLADSEVKDQSNTLLFVTLEQKLSILEGESIELTHQNQILSDDLLKKEKYGMQKSETIEDLTIELENVKKVKAELFGELLTLKQNFTVEKENLKHVSADLKEEENKNSNLKLFNTEILKEKETLIRKEAELSEKVNGLEDKIQILMIEIAEKNEELTKRETIISEYRESSKEMHLQNSSSQHLISDLQLDLEREKEKIKDRERKILEKDEEFTVLTAQLKKAVTKHETEAASLKQELESLEDTLKKQQTTSVFKCSDFEVEIKKLKEVEKKLNEANISLEEEIFFEKQMNSIASSKADEFQQQISSLNIDMDKLNSMINELNDEIKEKEESLFALSGKLYASDHRLENKDEEFVVRTEKQDLEWRYKLEEICEDYENKIDLMERERSYVKTDIEGSNESVQKLEHQKEALQHELEREREIWESKLKKAEEEKLLSLIEKNRQIEKNTEVFEELEEKLKRKYFDLKTVEDDKKKVEEKMRELKIEVQKSDQNKNEAIKTLEREIDQLRRKEGQLKRFKEALKNNQWATEREIKKGIQTCGKSMVNLASEESKDEAVSLMKNLETTLVRLACPNIDEI